MRRIALFVFACLFAPLAAAGVLDAISAQDAAGGVREALSRGADYAVDNLGKENGFLGNKQLKIPLPGALKKAEKALKLMGKGKEADELVTAMNHAAEHAVAEARPILKDAVKSMTLADAKAILTGGDDSVTQYFRKSTGEALAVKFRPIVQQATQKVDLGKVYNKFAGKAAGLGLVDKEDADLDTYVTNKAMDGLFSMIAAQEKQFRANPLGAGSDLLKKVFGAL